MTTHYSRTLGLLLIVLFPSDGSGQAVGTVRVRRDGTDSVVAMGQLVARSRDRLIFEGARTRSQYTFSTGDVVERYQTGRATGLGAKIGATLGVSIGLALGMKTQDESECGLGDPFCGTDIGRVATGAILGAGLGAGGGALVGGLFKEMGWSQIDPFELPEAPVQVTLIPEPQGIGLLITIRR